MRAAIAVALLLVLLMGYVWFTLTGWHKDNVTGPFLGVLAVLALVLAVGVTEMLTSPRGDRSER
jgi:hypothetical protein